MARVGQPFLAAPLRRLAAAAAVNHFRSLAAQLLIDRRRYIDDLASVLVKEALRWAQDVEQPAPAALGFALGLKVWCEHGHGLRNCTTCAASRVLHVPARVLTWPQGRRQQRSRGKAARTTCGLLAGCARNAYASSHYTSGCCVHVYPVVQR